MSIPHVFRFKIFAFWNIFRIYKTVKFPDITNLNKMLRSDTFVPITTHINWIDGLKDIVKDSHSLIFSDCVFMHVFFEILCIRLSQESEHAFVRYGD